MVSKVALDFFVSINGVDLSDHVRSATLTDGVNIVDATAMGNAAMKRLAGLRDYSLTVEFEQDYAAGKTHATLVGLVGVETAIKVRHSKTDAISATNPEAQFNGMLESYPFMDASLDELHTISVTFQVSDGAVIVYDITP